MPALDRQLADPTKVEERPNAILSVRKRVFRSPGKSRFRLLPRMRQKGSRRRNRAPRPYDRSDKPQVQLHLSGLGQGDATSALARGLGQDTPDGNWCSGDRPCRPPQAGKAQALRTRRLGVQARQARDTPKASDTSRATWRLRFQSEA